MKAYILILSVLIFVVSIAAAEPKPYKPEITAHPPQVPERDEWSKLQNVLGQKGIVKGRVLGVSYPRTDISATVGNVPVSTAFALTSQVNFQRHGDMVIMVGELALLDAEVGPVVERMARQGITVTGIHQHLLGMNPQIWWVHFIADGDETKLGKSLMNVLAGSGTLNAPSPTPGPAGAEWATMMNVLGYKGDQVDGVLMIHIPRANRISEMGVDLSPEMGTQIEIEMEMNGANVATTGELALLGSEVGPVIKALEDNGIVVTALHNHMLSEQPRLFFLHFWGFDTPERISMGIKAALENINLGKQPK